jgi:hypothetical protein
MGLFEGYISAGPGLKTTLPTTIKKKKKKTYKIGIQKPMFIIFLISGFVFLKTRRITFPINERNNNDKTKQKM